MLISKKITFFLSIVLLSFTLVACGAEKETTSSTESNDSNNSGEVIELNVNNWTHSTHHLAKNVYEPWQKMVEEKTDGRVKVNLFHGSSLGASTSVYQDVVGGVYEVGILVTNYYYDTNFFPYTIGSLPFAFQDPESASKVLAKFGEKYANDKITDVVIMGMTASDSYDLFSGKPIESIDDLKNLKMRASGKAEIPFVQNIGGVPVSIATDELYEGLQKGTLDTAFYTPSGAIGLKIYEPAPYITKLGVQVTPDIPIMNQVFFDSLPEDLKNLFEEELNPALADLVTESYTNEAKKAHEVLANEVAGKGKVITLSENEMKKFRNNAKSAWDAWVEDANKKGYDGEKMVEDLIKMIEEGGYPKPF